MDQPGWILCVWVSAPAAQAPAPFEVHEATIAGIHAAMKAGRLTCRALVEQYLRRLDAYDKNGPRQDAGPCMGFKYDINRYLASHGGDVPIESLTEIVKSNRCSAGSSIDAATPLAGVLILTGR